MSSKKRESVSSPPYYRPSPQQQYSHHPPHYQPYPGPGPEYNMSMSMYSPPVGPPGGPGGIILSSGRHPHYPPSSGGLPGAGGLYSMGDIPSPPSSFHMSMSMVDHSTPTNMSMRGSLPPHILRGAMGGGGDMTGIRDLNNYSPVHKIKLEEDAKRLFTVENNVTRETIVVLTSGSKIMFFMLKVKNDDGAKLPSEKFAFDKFHELSIQPHDLEAFVISQNCSITLIPFKLTYAVSTRGGKTVFVYDQGDSNRVPDQLSIEDANEEDPDSPLILLNHDYPVTHLALDAEKNYLATVQELGTICIWECTTRTKLAVFHIPNQCVFLSFHRSEPFQLLAIDVNGWVRYFNVFRQCCFRSIHLVQTGVFSADWSSSNSNIVAAGFAESFTVVDSSKMISSLNKCYEVPEQVINAIKINPVDDKVFATLSRLTGTIQLWRDNFGTHIWKHRNAHVNDIAWVHGYPYLLALGHQTLFIYESSVS